MKIKAPIVRNHQTPAGALLCSTKANLELTTSQTVLALMTKFGMSEEQAKALVKR